MQPETDRVPLLSYHLELNGWSRLGLIERP